MPEQQKLYIIRKEYDGFGGAENVAKRYIDHFSEFLIPNWYMQVHT